MRPRVRSPECKQRDSTALTEFAGLSRLKTMPPSLQRNGGELLISRAARFNAENILFIATVALAERYRVYIDHLIQKYRGSQG
jgi:hypothetical protein